MNENDYYRGELVSLVEEWSVERIDDYIAKLEDRIAHTKDQLIALRALRRKKTRNMGAKDTGGRGGK